MLVFILALIKGNIKDDNGEEKSLDSTLIIVNLLSALITLLGGTHILSKGECSI